MINIGICFGGKSVEHDISCVSYFQLYHALDKKKYNILPIYLDKNNNFKTFDNKVNNISDFIKAKKKGLKIYKYTKKLELVILALHGKGLESGEVRGYFDLLGITCVSPSVKASTIFHNKYLTKLICANIGIRFLPYFKISKEEYEKNSFEIDKKYKNEKVIIKPTSLGSSIGICKSSNLLEFQEAIINAFNLDDEVIIEPIIENFREISQACYKKNGKIILSKLDEVVTKDGYYSFEEKYKPKESFHIIPSNIENKLRSKISNITKRLISEYGDTGVYRVDYIIKDEIVYVNEVNVIPGAFAFSLFEAKGISFSRLIEDLIEEAIHQKLLDGEKVTTYDTNILDSMQKVQMKK